MLSLLLALVTVPALAAPSEPVSVEVREVKCSLANAAGAADFSSGSRHSGVISSNYGIVPVTSVEGQYEMGVLQLNVTYTSRLFQGGPVTVAIYLWAPQLQAGGTLYGTLFARQEAGFFLPAGPFGGGSSYMDPLQGWHPQNLTVGLAPVAFAQCEIRI
jgi:hypothetical protein